jgi:hypothetical protein
MKSLFVVLIKYFRAIRTKRMGDGWGTWQVCGRRDILEDIGEEN